LSIYAVSKFFYELGLDEHLAHRARTDLESVLEEYDVSDSERAALLSGDVATLYRMGVHAFLLNSMSRHGLGGVTKESYRDSIRAAR